MSNHNQPELCVEPVTFPLELDSFIAQSATENIEDKDRSSNNDGPETDSSVREEIGKAG